MTSTTLSISPKADANEHMEVTWKYDVDVARRENGKGGMKWPREKSRDGHVDLTGEREKMLRLCVHVSGIIIGLLPDRLEDISFFSFYIL